jgi:hypothetical protein
MANSLRWIGWAGRTFASGRPREGHKDIALNIAFGHPGLELWPLHLWWARHSYPIPSRP